jgi:hypothetical protein
MTRGASERPLRMPCPERNNFAPAHRPPMTLRRDGEAKQILAPVYGRFTAGFETTNPRAVRAMLATLPT